MMRVTLYICVAALVLCGCKEKEIEEIELAELDGTAIDMQQFRGKTVFINFWATWCGPCIKEMPSIDKAQAALKDNDVVFLVASNEEPAEITEFKNRQSFKLHYVRLLNLEQLKIAALPTTYIFDPDGNLKFSETGAREWDQPDNLNLITE